MDKFVLLTIVCISFKVNADSKCSEFTPVSIPIDHPEDEWIAVVLTVPKGHETKFCYIHHLHIHNATAAIVDATINGKTIGQFLMTVPESIDTISSIDLHMDALPDPPKLQKTYYLAHYMHGHYYCFVQCSMNYDLYDDFVSCFTTKKTMSDADRSDVDGFIEKLDFQLNDKNDTIHIDTTDC